MMLHYDGVLLVYGIVKCLTLSLFIQRSYYSYLQTSRSNLTMQGEASIRSWKAPEARSPESLAHFADAASI